MPRHLHGLDDLLHVGSEPASAIVLSDDIGPFPQSTTVAEFLDAIGVIAEAFHADGFAIDAVIKDTSENIVPWTWVRRLSYSDSFAYLNGIHYSNGLWMAVGDDVDEDVSGTVFWTHDPTGEWTKQPGWEQSSYFGVYSDGTTWVIVDTGGRIWTSATPTVDHHWVMRLDATGPFFGVIFASGHWVAWGASGSTSRLYTAGSTPTGTWTSRSVAAFTSPGLIDITFGNGTWVAVSGNGSSISTATNPTSTWTNQGTVGVQGTDRIRYANGYWLICGALNISGTFHGGPWYATSPTGPWTRVTSPATRFTSDAVWDGTRWVVIGMNSSFQPMTLIATDPSGTWTQVTAPDFPGDIWRIAYDGRVYVASGIGDDDESALETTLSFAYTAFTVDAHIARLLTIDASIIRPAIEGSVVVGAVLASTQTGSVVVDAAISNAITTPGSYAIDAYVAGNLTVDAVIVSAMDSFDPDAFQEAAFQ